MLPKEFEDLVSEYFRKQGYEVISTNYSHDWGVDAFAKKENEKIAIQAKMYGETTRKVNRQMVMELYGAKVYFDCTGAVIVTDGKVLPDAFEVANKLKINILLWHDSADSQINSETVSSAPLTFDSIWKEYIMPLEGKTLARNNGETNKILKVDWGGVKRTSKNGNISEIKLEIFKYAVEKLLANGYITREEINQEYIGRASSGIVLVLSQVPFFVLTEKPKGLKYIEPEQR